MGLVKYLSYGRNGSVSRGEMEYRDACCRLAEEGAKARKLMLETGAAHVLYGLKLYNEDQLVAVHFYMEPMDEKQFHRVTGRIRNSIVYALHNGTYSDSHLSKTTSRN